MVLLARLFELFHLGLAALNLPLELSDVLKQLVNVFATEFHVVAEFAERYRIALHAVKAESAIGVLVVMALRRRLGMVARETVIGCLRLGLLLGTNNTVWSVAFVNLVMRKLLLLFLGFEFHDLAILTLELLGPVGLLVVCGDEVGLHPTVLLDTRDGQSLRRLNHQQLRQQILAGA